MKKLLLYCFITILLILSTCRGNNGTTNEREASDELLYDKISSYSTTPPPTNPTEPIPSEKPKVITNIKLVTLTLSDCIDFAMYTENVFCVYTGAYSNTQRKYGFIRDDGAEITPYIYDYAYPFTGGLACVRIDRKYGYINSNGQTVLPFIYDNATPFAEGLAYFEYADTYGFIDHEGSVKFLLDCDSVSSFCEGLAFFSIDGKYGYIGIDGKVAIEPVFDEAFYFTAGFAKVRVGNKLGVIDIKGDYIIDPVYDDINMHGDYFAVDSGMMQGVIHTSGEIIIPLTNEFVYVYIYNDLTCINTKGKMIVIYPDGEKRELDTSDEKSYLVHDRGDLIRVITNEKYGYLDAKDFSVIIPPMYDYAKEFAGNYASVRIGDTYGVINKEGDIVVPFSPAPVDVFPNDTFAVNVEGKYQLIDSYGNILNERLYDCVIRRGDGYMVWRNSFVGFLDETGYEIIPPIYITCYYSVLGNNDCIILKTAPGDYSVVVLSSEQNNDLTKILLRNEITPRIKPYGQFIKYGEIRLESHESNVPYYTERINELNDFVFNYKLLSIGDGTPLLHYYAYQFISHLFPVSRSGFLSVENGELKILLFASKCGGSIGGTITQMFKDDETGELLIGTSSNSHSPSYLISGKNIYRYSNGSANQVVSCCCISRCTSYYEDGVERYKYGAEYYINDEQVTAEEYDKLPRYSDAKWSIICEQRN